MMSFDQDQHPAPSVVVTGASGFLGGAVVAALQKQRIPVVAISRQPGSNWTQVENYSAAPEGDVLVHLAEDGNRQRVNGEGDAYTAAVRSTMTALLAKKYRRVIYASSAAIYGDASTQPHASTDHIQLTDTYSRAKRECELMVLDHSGGVVVRLANLYGPGMSPQNVISAILAQVPGEGDVSLWNVSPVRDFLWIDDAAAGIVAMALGEATGIYNLGSGVGHAVREIAETTLALAGQSHRRIQSTNPAEQSSHLTLAIDATVRDFGWKPETSLKDGLGCLITSKLSPQ